MMVRDLINSDMSKMFELEFKTTMIRTPAGLEKTIEDI